MTEPIRLVLPWPPSVNTYWRRVADRVLISREGRRYRADVAAEVMVAGAAHHLREAVAVDVVLHPPDYRVRDTDNVLKALLDALTYAGVIEDDRQVRDLAVRWECPERPGSVRLAVRPLGYTLEEWRERCRTRSSA